MLAPQNLSNVTANSNSLPPSKFMAAIARLATFIEYHSHDYRRRNSADGTDVAEIRSSDAEIAFQLGISLVALEQAFAELVGQNVIRLQDAYRIEIRDRGRLAQFARRSE